MRHMHRNNKQIKIKVLALNMEYIWTSLFIILLALILASCAPSKSYKTSTTQDLQNNITFISYDKKVKNSVTQEELFCLEQGGFEGEPYDVTTIIYYSCLADRIEQMIFFGITNDLVELRDTDIEYLELLSSKYRAKAKSSLDAYTRQQSEIGI